MPIPFLDLRAQLAPIRADIDRALHAVMESQAYVLGPFVTKFEVAFGAYLGVPHVVGMNSGTDALLIALRALGVGPGDEVLTAANGFFATAEAICHAGATPVFVDADPATALMDLTQLPAAITRKTRAIIPVHLYGQPVAMGPVLTLAKTHRWWVIEDACQAHGAIYKGRQAGTWGDVGCFSFYPGKNLGALGDGGALVTRDPAIAERARQLINHGGIKKYQHDQVGYNSRLDAMQAAILTVKLRHLDRWNAARNRWATAYRERLVAVRGVTTLAALDERRSNDHLFVIRVAPDRRDQIRARLDARGIATGIHYPQPLHEVLAALGRYPATQRFPVAEALCRSILSLPMYAELTEPMVDEVVDGLQGVCA